MYVHVCPRGRAWAHVFARTRGERASVRAVAKALFASGAESRGQGQNEAFPLRVAPSARSGGGGSGAPAVGPGLDGRLREDCIDVEGVPTVVDLPPLSRLTRRCSGSGKNHVIPLFGTSRRHRDSTKVHYDTALPRR